MTFTRHLTALLLAATALLAFAPRAEAQDSTEPRPHMVPKADRGPQDTYFDYTRALIASARFSRFAIGPDSTPNHPEYTFDPPDPVRWDVELRMLDVVLPLAGDPETDRHLLMWGAALLRGEILDLTGDIQADWVSALKPSLRYDGPYAGVEIGAYIFDARFDELRGVVPAIKLHLGSRRYGALTLTAEWHGASLLGGDTNSLEDNADYELELRVPITDSLHARGFARYRDIYEGPGKARQTDELYTVGLDFAYANHLGVRIIPIFVGIGYRVLRVNADAEHNPYYANFPTQDDSALLLVFNVDLGVRGFYGLW